MPGNYVFAKQQANGTFTAIYIGETEDLGTRLADHERRPCAIKNGATHILVRANNGGEQARLREEAELIAHCKPVCNVQGK